MKLKEKESDIYYSAQFNPRVQHLPVYEEPEDDWNGVYGQVLIGQHVIYILLLPSRLTWIVSAIYTHTHNIYIR